MQQKVQRIEVRQLESLNRSFDHALKMSRDACRRYLLHEERIVLRRERDQADVRGVALIPGTGMGQLHKAELAGLPSFHASISSTAACTIRLSINAGQYATICSGLGRPPAKPVTLGGPLRMKGAISRVKRSTAAWSDARTPMRNCTSGSSSSGARSSARRPWVASAPTNSVRIASNWSPKSLRRCRTTRSAALAFWYASGQA